MRSIEKGNILISFILIQSLIVTNLFFYAYCIVPSGSFDNPDHADYFFNTQSPTITGTIFDSSLLNNVPARLLEFSSEKKNNNESDNHLFQSHLQETNLNYRNSALRLSDNSNELVLADSLYKLYCSFKIPSA